MKAKNRTAPRAMGALLLGCLGAASCVGAPEPDAPCDEGGLCVSAVGAHLSGISDSEFASARAEFVKIRTVEDGLGPIYNARSCGSCHSLGAPGGAGAETALRFGSFTKDGIFDGLAMRGGTLLHTGSLGAWTTSTGTRCQVPTEMVPAEATVTTQRLPTPLYGAGLLVAMPDQFFVDLAQSEPEAVRGVVNLVRIALPDVEDPAQDVGGQRVGRLTWKAATVGITQFASAAFLNEVGISTQHCVKGKSVTTYATDLPPNGVALSPVECQDGIPGTDYSVGSCDDNRTAIEPHVAAFAKYIKFLAPPPRPPAASSPAAMRGESVFTEIGCAGCHTTRAFTTPDQPFNGVPGSYEFHPYSDYLLHDVGDLGDNVGQTGETAAKVHMMKTAPLWGVRLRPRLLHDGRATDIPGATHAHGGQAAAAAQAFDRLSGSSQDDLVTFVLSL